MQFEVQDSFHNLLHTMYIRSKFQCPKCTTGPFNKCKPKELRKRVWTLKADDADLQSAPEMMGARPQLPHEHSGEKMLQT